MAKCGKKHLCDVVHKQRALLRFVYYHECVLTSANT